VADLEVELACILIVHKQANSAN